jgi:hypothetical protein
MTATLTRTALLESFERAYDTALHHNFPGWQRFSDARWFDNGQVIIDVVDVPSASDPSVIYGVEVITDKPNDSVTVHCPCEAHDVCSHGATATTVLGLLGRWMRTELRRAH